MASVFVIIAVLIFGGDPWLRTLDATTGSFFLFLGLKKKNRDHLMCSMHLFGAALLARPAVLDADWALPLLLFGATVFSAERYLEKKPQQVAFLPVILGVWAWFDGFWLLGLVYTAAYILCPRSDRPGATKILVRSVIGGAAAGLIVMAVRLMGTDCTGRLLVRRSDRPAALAPCGRCNSHRRGPGRHRRLRPSPDRAPQDQPTALCRPRTVGYQTDRDVRDGRRGSVLRDDLQTEHRLRSNSPLHLARRVALFLPGARAGGVVGIFPLG